MQSKILSNLFQKILSLSHIDNEACLANMHKKQNGIEAKGRNFGHHVSHFNM